MITLFSFIQFHIQKFEFDASKSIIPKDNGGWSILSPSMMFMYHIVPCQFCKYNWNELRMILYKIIQLVRLGAVGMRIAFISFHNYAPWIHSIPKSRACIPCNEDGDTSVVG